MITVMKRWFDFQSSLMTYAAGAKYFYVMILSDSSCLSINSDILTPVMLVRPSCSS